MTNFSGQSGINKKLLVAVVGLAVVLVVIAAVFVGTQFFGESKADNVFGTCSEPGSGLTIDGDTLRIQDPNGERRTAYTRARDCVVRETGMPPNIEDRMMWTGVDIGSADGQWDEWKAAWTYSVEDGLILSVTSD